LNRKNASRKTRIAPAGLRALYFFSKGLNPLALFASFCHLLRTVSAQFVLLCAFSLAFMLLY
jgi:hypothetical protein